MTSFMKKSLIKSDQKIEILKYSANLNISFINPPKFELLKNSVFSGSKVFFTIKCVNTYNVKCKYASMIDYIRYANEKTNNFPQSLLLQKLFISIQFVLIGNRTISQLFIHEFIHCFENLLENTKQSGNERRVVYQPLNALRNNVFVPI